MSVRQRYDELAGQRNEFLDVAVECSRLTLPYLISDDVSNRPTHKRLRTPWQSVGAKSVVTLASKLMLALLPPQTTFFKLQVNDAALVYCHQARCLAKLTRCHPPHFFGRAVTQ